jgi:hypothetical protein
MVAQDVHQETLEEPQEERQEALEAARCRRRMVCALERALHQATASIATIRALRQWLSRSSSIRTYQSLPLQATASSQSGQAITAHTAPRQASDAASSRCLRFPGIAPDPASDQPTAPARLRRAAPHFPTPARSPIPAGWRFTSGAPR